MYGAFWGFPVPRCRSPDTGTCCLQEVEWADGPKESSCSCHDGSGDLRLKKSKRRSCGHCGAKVGLGGLRNDGNEEEIKPETASGEL